MGFIGGVKMKIQFSDKTSSLVLSGKAAKNTIWGQIENLNELIYRGEILGFNKKDDRCEILGQSVNGKPDIEADYCRNCPNIFTNHCKSCYRAQRDPKWFVLPEEVTLNYNFARH